MKCIEIVIQLKPGILDTESEAIMDGLCILELGQEVIGLRRQKVYLLEVDRQDDAGAIDLGHRLAQRLLVNGVVEDYHLSIIDKP